MPEIPVENLAGEEPEEIEPEILASAKIAGREYLLAADPETAGDDDREVYVLVKIDDKDGSEDDVWSLYRDATEEEAEAVGDMLIGIAEEAMSEEDES